MKKILTFLLCFATLVALFSIKNTNSEFSFEQWLTNISEVSDNRPTMPSTDDVDFALDSFKEYEEDADVSEKILVTIENFGNVFTVGYECIVFAVKFLIYIVEYILYLSTLVSVMFYNLFVW